MAKRTAILHQLDWLVALACISWGLLDFIIFSASLKNSIFWVGGGALGLLLAWANPAKIIEKQLARRFVKKKASSETHKA